MKKIFLGLALLAGLCACSDNDTSNKSCQVQFALTDAPSLKGYKALYVDVEGIEYNVGDSAWKTLAITPARINLMNLTNGTDTLLGNVELEAGQTVSQVRLILGDNNTLVLADGTEKSVKVPSGQQSGLKINIQSSATLTSGYKVMIDFDAERSVVAKGNGQYSLKPVLRGFIVVNTSKVYGTIVPAKVTFQVRTMLNNDTLTTISDTLRNNYFALQGLTSGTYNLIFLNAGGDTLYSISQQVHGGTDVNMGVITIPQH